jgi:hypothetical protein
MTVERRRPAWKGHELVTKAIFEALLKLDNVRNMDIRHNVKVQGITTEHQIDVLWEFEAGGVDHLAIVQVKKEKARAKKGELLLFQSVLADIPGQPRGIFVAENGYQSGALEVAGAHGIAAYEIRKIDRNTPRDPIQITIWSVGLLALNREKMAGEGTFLIPTLSEVQVTLDGQWLALHPGSIPANLGAVPMPELPDIQFVDDAGNVHSTFRSLVQSRVLEVGQEGKTSLEIEFPDPTYMKGMARVNKDGDPVGNIKVLRIVVTLDIRKHMTTTPMFSATGATYLFKKAMERNERYVLIAENGADIEAHLSARDLRRCDAA